MNLAGALGRLYGWRWLRVDVEVGVVLRCQLGERAAFRELVEGWHPKVWGFVRAMVGRDEVADDVTQDVWVAVVRGLPRLRAAEGFGAWVFTIARRAVANHLRAQYAEARATEMERVQADPAEELVDRVDVARWLAEVPVVEREVLVLFHLEDLSLDECAQVLGVPVGTVKSRLYRARRMVREVASREVG